METKVKTLKEQTFETARPQFEKKLKPIRTELKEIRVLDTRGKNKNQKYSSGIRNHNDGRRIR